jgi:hypothetical protein
VRAGLDPDAGVSRWVRTVTYSAICLCFPPRFTMSRTVPRGFTAWLT